METKHRFIISNLMSYVQCEGYVARKICLQTKETVCLYIYYYGYNQLVQWPIKRAETSGGLYQPKLQVLSSK